MKRSEKVANGKFKEEMISFRLYIRGYNRYKIIIIII